MGLTDGTPPGVVQYRSVLPDRPRDGRIMIEGSLPRMALRAPRRGARGRRAGEPGDAPRPDRDGRWRRLDPPVAAAVVDVTRRAGDAARLRLPAASCSARTTTRRPVSPSTTSAAPSALGARVEVLAVDAGRDRSPRAAGHRARLPGPGDATRRHHRLPANLAGRPADAAQIAEPRRPPGAIWSAARRTHPSGSARMVDLSPATRHRPARGLRLPDRSLLYRSTGSRTSCSSSSCGS